VRAGCAPARAGPKFARAGRASARAATKFAGAAPELPGADLAPRAFLLGLPAVQRGEGSAARPLGRLAVGQGDRLLRPRGLGSGEARLERRHEVDDLRLGRLCRSGGDLLALDLALDQIPHLLALVVLIVFGM